MKSTSPCAHALATVEFLSRRFDLESLKTVRRSSQACTQAIPEGSGIGKATRCERIRYVGNRQRYADRYPWIRQISGGYDRARGAKYLLRPGHQDSRAPAVSD